MPHSQSDHYPIMDEAFCREEAPESFVRALEEITGDFFGEASMDSVPEEQKMFVYLPRITHHVSAPKNPLKSFPFISCERNVYMTLFFEDFRRRIRAVYDGMEKRKVFPIGEFVPYSFDEMRAFRKKKNLPDAVQVVRFPLEHRGMFVVVLNETSFSIANTDAENAYFVHYEDCAEAAGKLYTLLVQWMSVVSANMSMLNLPSDIRIKFVDRATIAQKRATPTQLTPRRTNQATPRLENDPRYAEVQRVPGSFARFAEKIPPMPLPEPPKTPTYTVRNHSSQTASPTKKGFKDLPRSLSTKRLPIHRIPGGEDVPHAKRNPASAA